MKQKIGKRIIFDTPMPPQIKEAIDNKRQWREDVQSGKIKLPTEKLKRII